MCQTIPRVILFLLLALPAIPMAATPPGQLPRTGQTTCYSAAGALLASCAGTGQDGEIRSGLPWPDVRFTDNGDGTITDTMTGLAWAKDANIMATRDPLYDNEYIPGFRGGNTNIYYDGAVSWQRGLDYVAYLNSLGYLGYDDWRLPNANELFSIVHTGQADPAGWLMGRGFVNVMRNNTYFSSTPLLFAPANLKVAAVGFSDGWLTAMDRPTAGLVWPVRTARTVAPAVPAKTGRTSVPNASDGSLYPGDDGAQQAGTAWPDPRFSVQGAAGSELVTDSLTGLVWPKNAQTPGPAACAPGTAKAWQAAYNHVNCLNLNAFLGFTDWRLPNRSELVSLIQPARPNGQPADPAAPANNLFAPVGTGQYWTSDTDINSPLQTWWVGFTSYSNKAFKSMGSYYVFPVRGAALAPSLTVAPPQHNFGTIAVGKNASQSFTLTNGGTGDLTFGTITDVGPAAADYGVTSNLCSGATLAPAGTCVVQATFAPSAAGQRPASLQIVSTAPLTPLDYVPLTGNDTTPPAILATTPLNGATGVEVGTAVTITFSEAIDPATLSGRITVSGGVTGVITYDARTFTAIFTPGAPLAFATAYTVTVAAGITDVAGNSFAGSSFSFTTAPAPLLPLKLTVAGTGSGTVSSSPPGVACSTGPCTGNFAPGTPVTLSAFVNPGSQVTAWGGDCTTCTGLTCAVTMSAAKVCTAAIDLIPGPAVPLNVTVSGTGSGTITSYPAGITCTSGLCTWSFPSGTPPVTLFATVSSGSQTPVWGGDCAACAGLACSVIMSGTKSCTAAIDLSGTLLPLTISVTPDKTSPQVSGSTIAFKATATGGSGNFVYQFWLKDTSGVYTLVQPYSASNIWNWNTAGLPQGAYSVAAQAKSFGTTPVNGFDVEGVVGYVLTPPPVQSMNIVVAPASPQYPGTQVSIAATNVSGGSGTYLYQFWLKDTSGVYTLVQPYSSANVFNWNTTGLPAGTYSIAVQAKSAGSGSATGYDVEKVVNYILLTPPATSLVILVSPGSPKPAGTPVSVTATAGGGSGTYLYQFWLKDTTGVYSLVQPYSSANVFNWNTTGLPAGTYSIAVQAQSLGSVKPNFDIEKVVNFTVL